MHSDTSENLSRNPRDLTKRVLTERVFENPQRKLSLIKVLPFLFGLGCSFFFMFFQKLFLRAFNPESGLPHSPSHLSQRGLCCQILPLKAF